MKSPKNLILYKDFENGKLLYAFAWIIENYNSEYYNKEDIEALLFECLFATQSGPSRFPIPDAELNVFSPLRLGSGRIQNCRSVSELLLPDGSRLLNRCRKLKPTS